MYSQRELAGRAEVEKRLDERLAVENVNRRLVTQQEECRGEPVKGQLIFDAAFESGNLGKVEYVSECEYDLYIRPDTNSPRHRVWFYFTVQNVRAGQRVVFNVVNFSKPRSLYRDGMAPMAESTSRPRWQRIPSQHAIFEKSAAHKDQFVISFAFEFDREDDVYYFAYCFPFTYTQLQRYLMNLEERRMDYFKRELLATSQEGLRLDVLTITDPSNFHSDKVQRVIFITSRVHAGETPASFVCQGLIDFLVSENLVAATLRQNFIFKVVPMLNPDGVFLGNGRCSSSGFDLNRCWENPSEKSHQTIAAVKKLLEEYTRNPQTRVEFFIDLHSHSQLLNAFMYGNVFSDDGERCDRQSILPTLLSEIAIDFSLNSTQFNTDPHKSGTGRRVMASTLDSQCMCYTFEVSVYGYLPNWDTKQMIPYTEDSYQELGKNLAYSFYEYLQVEKGARNVETRPFQSFLAKPSSEKTPITANGVTTVKSNQATSETNKTTKKSINRCLATPDPSKEK